MEELFQETLPHGYTFPLIIKCTESPQRTSWTQPEELSHTSETSQRCPERTSGCIQKGKWSRPVQVGTCIKSNLWVPNQHPVQFSTVLYRPTVKIMLIRGTIPLGYYSNMGSSYWRLHLNKIILIFLEYYSIYSWLLLLIKMFLVTWSLCDSLSIANQ